MQELITAHWCDWCYLREGRKVEAAETERVGLGGKEADIDSCADCSKVLDPLRELFAEIGKRAKAVVSASAPQAEAEKQKQKKEDRPSYRVKCGECSSRMDMRSRTQHAEDIHKTHAGTLKWLFEDQTLEHVWACGCGMTFPTVTGRRMHISRSESGLCFLPEDDDGPIPVLHASVV